jgi:hypothetical protein
MENQTTTNDKAKTDTQEGAAAAGAAARLGEKLKTRLSGVKAQLDAQQARAREKLGQSKLGAVQGKVRGALLTAVDKVKTGLDLPSKQEVSSLAQRIEELDRKLADYETRTSAAGKGKKKDAGDKTEWA